MRKIRARFENFGRVSNLKISARRVAGYPEFIPALKTRGIAPGNANNAIAHVFVNTECSGKPDKFSIFEVAPIPQIIPAGASTPPEFSLTPERQTLRLHTLVALTAM